MQYIVWQTLCLPVIVCLRNPIHPPHSVEFVEPHNHTHYALLTKPTRYQHWNKPTYIITRNFHKAEIEEFLCSILGTQAASLFVVRSVTFEQTTKVAVAQKLLAVAAATNSSTEPKLVLVDDSIDELVHVNRARASHSNADDAINSHCATDAAGSCKSHTAGAHNITCVLYSRTC